MHEALVCFVRLWAAMELLFTQSADMMQTLAEQNKCFPASVRSGLEAHGGASLTADHCCSAGALEARGAAVWWTSSCAWGTHCQSGLEMRHHPLHGAVHDSMASWLRHAPAGVQACGTTRGQGTCQSSSWRYAAPASALQGAACCLASPAISVLGDSLPALPTALVLACQQPCVWRACWLHSLVAATLPLVCRAGSRSVLPSRNADHVARCWVRRVRVARV